MIMISYARADLSAVLALVDDIEHAHEEVWLDRELTGGQAWWDTILDKVRTCDIFVVALSPSFLDSRACKSELDYAVRLGRQIVPVMIKEVPVQLAPTVIANAQIIDYRTRSVEDAIALISSIKGQPAPAPLPMPLPEPPKPPISYMNTFSERVDADNLTFTDQIHLVAELKDYLSRPSDRAVAAQLLRRLRLRPDITERVGRDIDELLLSLAVEDELEKSPPVLGGSEHEEASVLSPGDSDKPGPGDEPRAVLPGRVRTGHLRQPMLLVIGAAALVVVVVIAAVIYRRGADPGTDGPLPVSSPLASTQLIVPMEVGEGRWALFLADTTSSSPGRQLTNGAGYVSGPVVSPDRRTIIYVAADTGKVFSRTLRVAGAADLNGDRELFTLPDGCDRPVRPSWNPADPSMIALICIRDEPREHVLRLMTVDGSITREITAPEGKPRLFDTTFSHDGKRLGFWAGPADSTYDGGTLYTVSTAGGVPEPLLDPDDAKGRDLDVTFSPDGKYVVFVRRPASGKSLKPANLMRARADGSDVTPLTDDAQLSFVDPTWSPDSDRLAFVSDAPTSGLPDITGRVWTMKADGTDRRLLWTDDAELQQAGPGWTAR